MTFRKVLPIPDQERDLVPQLKAVYEAMAVDGTEDIHSAFELLLATAYLNEAKHYAFVRLDDKYLEADKKV